jgi:pimeloyl-ACP methyl ester carboxylesterase
LNVHFERHGHGPEHLVLVHGLSNSGRIWRHTVDRLDPDRFSIWTLDLPGCGESEAPASWDLCSAEHYAQDVRGLIELVGAVRPVVVGHSFGCAVALSLALDAPAPPRGVVLVAPASTQGIDFVSNEQFEQMLHPSQEATIAFARLAFHRPPSEADLAELEQIVLSASPTHTEGAMRSMRDFRVIDRLKDLRVPTFVIAGDRDRHVPVRFALQTAAAIPRCAVHVFHNVGHKPQSEVADQFVELLKEFVLEDLPRREASARPASPA